MSVFYLIVGLIFFVGLVVIHEFGHFLLARKNGVDIEEFGIGFPPRLWKKKMASGFILSINALPLGGFVRMKGEHNADESKGSFGSATIQAKVKILLAGIMANLAVALLLFTVLAFTGMPKLFEGQFAISSDTRVSQKTINAGVVVIEDVLEGSPASSAGLQKNDQILSINNTAITQPEKINEAVSTAGSEALLFRIKRSDAIIEKSIIPNTVDNEQKLVGIVTLSKENNLTLQHSTWSAPLVAVGLTKQISALTYQGIGGALVNLLKGNSAQASQSVAGPVGIFSILKDSSALGLSFVMMIIAVISLTLALINLLPIPSLDGGRLFVTLTFRLFNKTPTKKQEDLIHGIGFLALMVLFVLITVVDVNRLSG